MYHVSLRLRKGRNSEQQQQQQQRPFKNNITGLTSAIDLTMPSY